MANSKKEPPRGVLNQEKGSENFSLSRYNPSPDLAHFTEHYWIVRWDLRGKEPYRQDVSRRYTWFLKKIIPASGEL